MSAALHMDRVRGWLNAKGMGLPDTWPEYEDMGEVVALDVEQGSAEWGFVRCGLITTSALSLVMTAKKNQYSGGAQGFLARLVGERLIGEPYDWGNTGWTERGHEQEINARKWYALERGVEVRQVGFLLSKDGEEGGSPDGLVGDDGGVEIKCYGLDHHMRVVMGVDPIPDNPLQVQGLMRLTGRKWWDCVAYHPHPSVPNRLERIVRDEKFIGLLDGCVARAKKELQRGMERLAEIGTARIDSTDAANFLDVLPLSDEEKAALAADIETAKALDILPAENSERMMGWLAAGKWKELRAAWEVLQKAMSGEGE